MWESIAEIHWDFPSFNLANQITLFLFDVHDSDFVSQKLDFGQKVFIVDLPKRHAAKGPGVITCMTARNDVSVNDDGRDMWKVSLDMEDYAAALANCRTALQGDQVYVAQAEAAFSGKDFFRAASFYAKITIHYHLRRSL
ncbi:hypothetical protein Nepgr_014632 [Nepenthes gracilis]|uniref:Uncharacterized protein n=1 Tax=Nepenthes gracilis TaxID=150966 RepID=A0AAD3SM68_NEPGR|nr:hypothetical protein Nepgr_014632 [Nepenthes gracilis]